MSEWCGRERAAVGILHAGEMGARLGELLRARGHAVLGVHGGRSAATRRRAQAARIEDARSLRALAERADVVLSLVTPAAAETTACAFAAALPERERLPVFVDLNSIGPELARRLSDVLGERGVRFVDGAIHGQAQHLPDRAMLFLSGPVAPRVAELFEGIVAVRLLGSEIGAASRMKMLLGCLSKSLVALCLEVGAAAQQAEVWPAFWEQVERFYPELAAAAEGMAASLPRHASRRAAELLHAEATLRGLGCDGGVVRESRRLTQEVADADLPPPLPGSEPRRQLGALIESLRAARRDGANTTVWRRSQERA
jgi:3-hydroxyisobutyrate dehydrogenase-like beta-hydroxyacid dehydrogenase